MGSAHADARSFCFLVQDSEFVHRIMTVCLPGMQADLPTLKRLCDYINTRLASEPQIQSGRERLKIAILYALENMGLAKEQLEALPDTVMRIIDQRPEYYTQLQ
jgi:hypothetical protein